MPLDVGDVDGSTFLVMAGMGFDAAIMAEAAGPSKDRWGWLAYVAAGVKRLRSEAMTVDVTADGRTVVADRRARTVIVGNVGHLQGGIALLPHADPRDGLLDVAVVAPRRLTDWLAVAWRILLRRTGSDARLTLLRAEDVHVHSHRPHPRQFDGEVLEPARSLRATVQPAALLVKVPAP
ncbi:diacylglycerol kinase family protein [Mycobacterium sp. PSTR-4-N]|uniref:diacylglycerol/lipid kinase family protein n=1 Tax=Mycobacterium sp. PSTR-4-N TaxID=2917745 RepID=UPI001F151DC4|nr:hypothetical protein [Mycobacterium sp. PSTR-4-N]MCG7595683.1 hypothetical protein [Mycobacterium sp. PSTR-4-N]